MYFYKIGHYICNEENSQILVHYEKYDKNEITELIAEAINALLDLMPEKESNECTLQELESYYWLHMFLNPLIEDNIIDWLVKNKDFKKLEYEVEWMANGMISVFDKDSHDQNMSKIATLIRNRTK